VSNTAACAVRNRRGAVLTARLILVTHAATAATRRAAFPLDEPIERLAIEPLSIRADAEIRRGPELRCAQTCAAAGLDAAPDAGLREWDLGNWAGRTLDEIAQGDPAGATTWLTDPAAAPHGGESLAELLERVADWLAERGEGVCVAVSSPTVVRAALTAAIGSPPDAFWRFDVAPWTGAELTGRDGRWSVRSVGIDPGAIAALHRG
jgi:broad specificity phosphatase PhoE